MPATHLHVAAPVGGAPPAVGMKGADRCRGAGRLALLALRPPPSPDLDGGVWTAFGSQLPWSTKWHELKDLFADFNVKFADVKNGPMLHPAPRQRRLPAYPPVSQFSPCSSGGLECVCPRAAGYDGRSRGYGIVRFDTEDDAAAALGALRPAPFRISTCSPLSLHVHIRAPVQACAYPHQAGRGRGAMRARGGEGRTRTFAQGGGLVCPVIVEMAPYRC